MVEFDIDKAIVLTVSGVAAAFGALIALIIFTTLVRRVEQLTNRIQVRPFGGTSVTPSQALQGPSGDELPDHDAELAAAAASAVAMALEEEEMSAAGLQASAAPAGRTGEEGWKGYGRWQAFNSRNMRTRGR